MGLQEMGCGGMDWMKLTQVRDRWQALVTAVMNFQVPRNAGNFLTSWKPVSFSRKTLLHRVSKYILVHLELHILNFITNSCICNTRVIW
jgi:hypothetical protein